MLRFVLVLNQSVVPVICLVVDASVFARCVKHWPLAAQAHSNTGHM